MFSVHYIFHVSIHWALKSMHRDSSSPDQCGSVGWALSLKQGMAGSIVVSAGAWVAGLAPSQGTYERQRIDVSLFRQCIFSSLAPPFLSL